MVVRFRTVAAAWTQRGEMRSGWGKPSDPARCRDGVSLRRSSSMRRRDRKVHASRDGVAQRTSVEGVFLHPPGGIHHRDAVAVRQHAQIMLIRTIAMPVSARTCRGAPEFAPESSHRVPWSARPRSQIRLTSQSHRDHDAWH